MKKEYKMSAARQQELQDELTYLKTVREKEVAELIKEARGFGDLSENSEYDEAKNEQGKLYSRIAELEDILLHVVIIDESEGASNAVSIGCTVTVVDLKTGREMPPYKVVGSQEADPMHRAISEESPFGKALMGAKEGDEISVEAPVGIIHYRVEKIWMRPDLSCKSQKLTLPMPRLLISRPPTVTSVPSSSSKWSLMSCAWWLTSKRVCWKGSRPSARSAASFSRRTLRISERSCSCAGAFA